MLSRTKQVVFVLETPEMNTVTYKNGDFVREAAPLTAEMNAAS